ncbi:MAG: hypothetical protein AMJ61_16220 [Desulfobacterales bacterium SG8_35_2]|nr:MAG: hypothetical protein AMJ61_16220 [Desulfobacterales bacterium SG8_35_2]
MNTNFFDLPKRKKRDLLFELLTDVSREGTISKKEFYVLNSLIDNPSTKKATVTKNKQLKTTEKYTAEKEIHKTQIKATQYLSQEVYDNLDKAQIPFRTLVPEHLQSRISRSYIVNLSLNIILHEFKTKGKNIKLMHNIMQKT